MSENNEKIIRLVIPTEKTVPLEMQDFTPEENYDCMIIGMNAILQGRKYLSQKNNTEIYEKFQREIKKEYDNILSDFLDKSKKNEIDIIIKDGIIKKLQETTEEEVKKKIEYYEITNRKLMDELLQKEKIMKEKIKEELQSEREYLEKIRTSFESGKTTFEKSNIRLSNVSLGEIGEKSFLSILEKTFRGLDDVDIIETKNSSHKGDYNLRCKDFTILIDVKLYTGNVQVSSRDKLKFDIEFNNLDFGWMISLDSSINKYNKSNIQSEFYSGKDGKVKCIFYLNNFLCNLPEETLRSVYYISKSLNDIFKENVCDGNIEKSDFLKYKMDLKNKIEDYRKTIKERNSVMKNMTSILETQDAIVLNLIEDKITGEVNQLVNKHQVIMDWFSIHIEKGDGSVDTNTIWKNIRSSFNIKELDISKNIFLDIMKSKYPIVKKGGNYNLAGYVFKIEEDPKQKIDVKPLFK